MQDNKLLALKLATNQHTAATVQEKKKENDGHTLLRGLLVRGRGEHLEWSNANWIKVNRIITLRCDLIGGKWRRILFLYRENK